MLSLSLATASTTELSSPAKGPHIAEVSGCSRTIWATTTLPCSAVETKLVSCLHACFVSCKQKEQRPHIFGMTASPMDNKIGGDLSQVGGFFQTLERNLDAKVLSRI